MKAPLTPTLLLEAVLFSLAAGCQSSRTSTGAEPFAVSESHFAKLGTNNVHYVMMGKGPQTLLLVHGWCGNTHLWREQVPALSDHARLLLIDLPGHGQSDKPNIDYTLDLFAGAVQAVMQDAKVQKATLIGHSMGVPVICRVYALAPGKVSALVAVNGFLRRPKLDPERVEQFVGPYRTAQYREQAQRFLGAMFPNPGTEALRDQVLAEMLLTPQHVMYSALACQFDARLPAWDLNQANVPVKVINARSPVWSAEYETFARGLSGQDGYRVIEGAGHFLMLEKPTEFNAALLELLRQANLLAQ